MGRRDRKRLTTNGRKKERRRRKGNHQTMAGVRLYLIVQLLERGCSVLLVNKCDKAESL
jgi:hypothetical protein